MKKTLLLILTMAAAMAGSAFAANFPAYYPAKGFPNTGRVDAVYAEEGRVVIGDISYQISESVVVRSPTRRKDSLARIRKGVRVGFRTKGESTIVEFWLLPRTDESRRRR